MASRPGNDAPPHRRLTALAREVARRALPLLPEGAGCSWVSIDAAGALRLIWW